MSGRFFQRQLSRTLHSLPYWSLRPSLSPSASIFWGQLSTVHSFTVSEVGILSDIFQKAFLNFVVAAMAATSAVKGSAKLHTSMIRYLAIGAKLAQVMCHSSQGIGTQWLAACVLVAFFKVQIGGLRMSLVRLCPGGSVINQFNLDRLSGFEWSQKEAEMAQLTACSETNATECSVDKQVRSVS